MSKIAVVGCGLVGRAWAISFARAGHDVALWDENPDAPAVALDFVAGMLPDLVGNDLLNGETPEAVLGRIRPGSDLAAALEGIDYLQECTPEDLEVKRAVFARLDAAAPDGAILASSTSALLPSSFTEGLAGQARCLVAHPINPPYLIPAVELIPAPWTAADTVERVRALMQGAGHVPIVLEREIDGFVVNRLQGALLEEAFRLVDDGITDAEGVDAAIRDGLALRWSFMGPFETIDLNAPGGIRDYAERYQRIYARIHPSMQRRADWTGPVMDRIEADRRARLPEDRLADRHGWRDRRLMGLLAHKREADREIGE